MKWRPRDRAPGGADAADEARNVIAWMAGTNASDDAIEELARAASYLAEAHARVAAGKVLCDVIGLHREVQALLQSGRQRLRQTRDLLRIDSGLLAHACLLLGDLGRHEAARDYGTAALLAAQEAEADEGIAWSVKAKTARWQKSFAESAELARRGFEVSGPTPTRVELAYREAIAVAQFGDVSRARTALLRAERAAETVTCDGSSTSVWSFPAARAGDLLPVGRYLHRRPRRGPARCCGGGRLLERRRLQGARYLGTGPGRSRDGLPDDGFP